MFLSRQPPGSGDDLADLLEMAGMDAILGRSCVLVFLGDGVLRLRRQDRDQPGRRSLEESLQLVEEGLLEARADADALKAHGLDHDNLLLPVRSSSSEALRELLTRADHVMGW